MDKIYDQTKTEERWYKFWEDNGFFKADPNSSKPPYGLLMPPPNLTGKPHLGYAMQHTILDAIARFKRMQGYEVLLMPGVDHAGIQFEATFNKSLAKEGLSKQKLGRDEWLKRAWQFRDEVYQSFHDNWTVFGISADWEKEVFTLDKKVEKAVLEEFRTFFEQDLLYKGAYIVQWCPKDQTAIEDVEMEYEEKTVKLYFVRYQIEGVEEYITVATTRPETIYADTGIAIYPKHPKYNKLAGKNAINPLTRTKIPIFEDKRVDKKFGTGAVKMTPGHDPLDFEIGKDKNLPILHAVDKTGRMTKLASNLAGMKATDAREKAEEILHERKALEKTEEYTHSVPVCERCKTIIEPLISEEFFIHMEPLAKKALENIDKVNFIPKNYQKILSDWIKNLHDWCISRPLWWGYRIPVWYCEKCNNAHEIGKDKDMVISFEEPGKTCQRCGEKHWVQEEKILDTWFSSGIWPMATLGWPDKNELLEKYYPWDFELSAAEIRYLWIARMIMLGLWFNNDVPFKHMMFHGTLRDMQGRKISKSLNNDVDLPRQLERWGVDPVRMTLYSYSAPGRDGRISPQSMDERAKNFRNFATKLKNLSKFIIELKPEDAATETDFSHPEDTEIIQWLNGTIDKVTENLNYLQLHLAIEELYDFIWHKFADSYVEWSKKRRAEAQPALEYVFRTSLELLHPFMPFITEELWQKLPHQEKTIMLTKWPTK